VSQKSDILIVLKLTDDQLLMKKKGKQIIVTRLRNITFHIDRLEKPCIYIWPDVYIYRLIHGLFHIALVISTRP
jgi:hypothetical protein